MTELLTSPAEKLGFLARLSIATGAAAHVWAGFADGFHTTHPLGRAALFALTAWVMSLIVGVSGLAVSRGQSRTAMLAVAASLLGVALLMWV